MEVKREPDRCRLCFSPGTQYISIFESSASTLNIVDTLKLYFYDEVKESDVLPKVICCECWDKVEAFGKFSEEVIALREQYLQQHLNSAVKDENIEECATLNEEPEIHEEIICVEPVRPIGIEKEEESSENVLHVDTLNKHESLDIDDNDVFDNDDSSIFLDANELPENSDSIRLPQNINEVTPEQQQQIIDQYFDMNCDYCETVFKSFDDATSHYARKHKHEPRGYVRCCSLKLSARSLFNWHLVFHLNPDLFKCNECGIVKKTLTALVEHKAGHKTQFSCDICQRTFFLKSSVKRHMRDLHLSKTKFPCNECNESFRMQKHLDTHVYTAHPKGLDGYEEDVRNIKLNLSTEQINNMIEKKFNMKCDFCDMKFISLKVARQHYLSEHDNLHGYIKCCNIKIRTYKVMLDHIQWHIDPDTFKCRICNKETNGRPNLLKHIKSHEILLKKEFYCNICDRYFERGYLYKHHMERKHKEFDKNEPEVEDLEISDYIDASCDVCAEKEFATFNAVVAHYLDVHNTKDGYVKCCSKKFHRLHLIKDHIEWHRNPNIFRCNICNKTMISRLTLSQHKVLHTKKFFCNECQRSFRAANNLKKHMESHKGAKPKYICDICNKAYFTKRFFQIHFATHNPHKDKSSLPFMSYVCEFCAKVFTTKQQLQSHVQRKHSVGPKKPMPKFQCNICHAWYATKGILKTHQLMHTSGPQKCNLCDRISANANALKAHIRQVHDAPDFKCHLCEKSCKSKDSLKSHIGTHLNEKHYKCTYCDETFIWRTNMYKHRKQMHQDEWLAGKAKKKAAQMKP